MKLTQTKLSFSYLSSICITTLLFSYPTISSSKGLDSQYYGKHFSKESKTDYATVWKRKLLVTAKPTGNGGLINIKSTNKSSGSKDELRFRVQSGTSAGLDIRAEIRKKGIEGVVDIDDRVRLKCSSLYAVNATETTVNDTFTLYSVPTTPFDPITDSTKIAFSWNLADILFTVSSKEEDVPSDTPYMEDGDKFSVIKMHTGPIVVDGDPPPLITLRTYATPVKMTIPTNMSAGGLNLSPTDLKFSMAFAARFLKDNQYFVLKCGVQSRSNKVKTFSVRDDTSTTPSPTSETVPETASATIEVIELGEGTSFVAFETAAIIEVQRIDDDDDVVSNANSRHRIRRAGDIEIPVLQQISGTVVESDGEDSEDPLEQVSDKTEYTRDMYFTFGATGQDIAMVDDTTNAVVFWDPVVGAGTVFVGESSTSGSDTTESLILTIVSSVIISIIVS
jgi:hypothetical protein